jgi:hypothetical protein
MATEIEVVPLKSCENFPALELQGEGMGRERPLKQLSRIIELGMTLWGLKIASVHSGPAGFWGVSIEAGCQKPKWTEDGFVFFILHRVMFRKGRQRVALHNRGSPSSLTRPLSISCSGH